MNAHKHIEGYAWCQHCGIRVSACPTCHLQSTRHQWKRRYRKVVAK